MQDSRGIALRNPVNSGGLWEALEYQQRGIPNSFGKLWLACWNKPTGCSPEVGMEAVGRETWDSAIWSPSDSIACDNWTLILDLIQQLGMYMVMWLLPHLRATCRSGKGEFHSGSSCASSVLQGSLVPREGGTCSMELSEKYGCVLETYMIDDSRLWANILSIVLSTWEILRPCSAELNILVGEKKPTHVK